MIKAGGVWRNYKGQLPTKTKKGEPIYYYEYDIQHEIGKTRGSERFVRGTDTKLSDDYPPTYEKIYMTDSHYGETASTYGYPEFVEITDDESK